MISHSLRWLGMFAALLLVHAPSSYSQNLDVNQCLKVSSCVNSDTSNAYPAGRMVRIGVEPPTGAGRVVSGAIRITSPSQQYDSGVQELPLIPRFFMWDTTRLSIEGGIREI